MLQDERNSLLAENDVLTDRASQLDTFDDPSTPSGKKHSQLSLQLEQMQEENFRWDKPPASSLLEDCLDSIIPNVFNLMVIWSPWC